MIFLRVPPTLYIRRDSKFEVPDTSAFGLQSSDRLACLAFHALLAMGAKI